MRARTAPDNSPCARRALKFSTASPARRPSLPGRFYHPGAAPGEMAQSKGSFCSVPRSDITASVTVSCLGHASCALGLSNRTRPVRSIRAGVRLTHMATPSPHLGNSLLSGVPLADMSRAPPAHPCTLPSPHPTAARHPHLHPTRIRPCPHFPPLTRASACSACGPSRLRWGWRCGGGGATP